MDEVSFIKYKIAYLLIILILLFIIILAVGNRPRMAATTGK